MGEAGDNGGSESSWLLGDPGSIRRGEASDTTGEQGLKEGDGGDTGGPSDTTGEQGLREGDGGVSGEAGLTAEMGLGRESGSLREKGRWS